MKFDHDNLSVEYWKKKLTKYKGTKRKKWCEKIIYYIHMNVERPLSVRDAYYDTKMEQLERCIEELKKIKDDESYDEYENIARMWKVVKDIQNGTWNGRKWNQLQLITHGSNKDRYPNLKL